MTPSAPSNGEIWRRLDELVTELRRLADTLEEGYVRKDVLTAMSNATSIQLTGLEDEHRQISKRMDRLEEHGATNRRLIVSAFIAPIVVGVVVVLILTAIGVHK